MLVRIILLYLRNTTTYDKEWNFPLYSQVKIYRKMCKSLQKRFKSLLKSANCTKTKGPWARSLTRETVPVKNTFAQSLSLIIPSHL